jgi:hypothetical protein
MVPRKFLTKYHTEPPMDKTIREWYKKFQQSGCLCATKRTGRPGPSAEIVERVQLVYFARRRLRRMCQTLGCGICNSRLSRYVDVCGLLTKVSRTHPTVSADGLGRPDGFAAHRQPICWNFLCYSRIVLPVGGSV